MVEKRQPEVRWQQQQEWILVVHEKVWFETCWIKKCSKSKFGDQRKSYVGNENQPEESGNIGRRFYSTQWNPYSSYCTAWGAEESETLKLRLLVLGSIKSPLTRERGL